MDNRNHFNSELGSFIAPYDKFPRIEEGDRWGFSFINFNVNYVPRIIECGTGFRLPNTPLYTNMDYKPTKLRWYRYIK